MADYYLLDFQRKPEHLQWWLPREAPRPSPFTAAEIRQRLAVFARLRAQVDRLAAALPAADQDAFFELVAYPVRGAALANERYFDGELAALHAAAGMADATALAARATAADTELKEATQYFNEQIAGGKWRHILALEPADSQWRSFRVAPWTLPKFAATPERPAAMSGPAVAAPETGGFAETNGVVSIEAGHYTAKADRGGAGWKVVPGLGRTGDAVAVFPTTMRSVLPEKIAAGAPRLDYAVNLATTGEFTVQVNLVPTHPLEGDSLRFAVGLDAAPPQLVELDVQDGGAGVGAGRAEQHGCGADEDPGRGLRAAHLARLRRRRRRGAGQNRHRLRRPATQLSRPAGNPGAVSRRRSAPPGFSSDRNGPGVAPRVREIRPVAVEGGVREELATPFGTPAEPQSREERFTGRIVLHFRLDFPG